LFFVIQPDDCIKKLKDKIKLLEQEKAGESCGNVLTALRRHLNRSPSLFDRFEVIELLETLVRLARTQAHEKADEYAAALEEGKVRQLSLDSPHLQRLMLGVAGDPLRKKMAKEATSILKGISKTSSSSFQPRRPLPQFSHYSVQCYACAGWGNILLVTANPDVVAVQHVGADANYSISVLSVIQGFVRFVSKTFHLFVYTFLF